LAFATLALGLSNTKKLRTIQAPGEPDRRKIILLGAQYKATISGDSSHHFGAEKCHSPTVSIVGHNSDDVKSSSAWQVTPMSSSYVSDRLNRISYAVLALELLPQLTDDIRDTLAGQACVAAAEAATTTAA
jgi:hypothetical protein